MTKNNFVGATGAYFVAGELSKKGHIALLTNRNTAGIDIIVTNPVTYKSTNIQVKTTEKNPYWLLSKKDEEIHEDNLFYVFVKLGDKLEYHIVPNEIVSNRIKKHNQDYLKEKSSRKDANIRKFILLDSDKEKYLNNWNILQIS